MTEKTFTERSSFTIGVIIAVVVMFLTVLGAIGTFAFGVWQSGRWVGEINKSLDSIALDIKIVKNDQTELKMQLSGHENRLTKIETAGSPTLQKLNDQLIDLQRKFDLHAVKEEPRK